MKIPIEKQLQFLNWQLEEHEMEFMSYLRKPMKQHFAGRTAFYGKIWGADEKRSSLIIQFKRGMAPRLNQPLLGIVFKQALYPTPPSEWTDTYEQFRRNCNTRTDLLSVFILKDNDPEHLYMGFQGIEASFLEAIQKVLNKGTKPTLIIAEKDPPVEYLINLREFVRCYPTDTILNIDIEHSLEEWIPADFDNVDKKSEVCRRLEREDLVILQGPPGTGKSHLVAEIVRNYLEQNASVCITALTNKALLEVGEKPALHALLQDSRVRKTNLTSEEKRRNLGLQNADKLTIGRGELLLATYYKLSEWYKADRAEAREENGQPYDLVVIEEASQSFLATIAAFRRLGKKVLVVGDPLQLPPIVLNENAAPRIHQRIMSFARGLESFAANWECPAYLLTESYRLGEAAAKMTGMFYQNRLVSRQASCLTLTVAPENMRLMPESGGIKMVYLPMIQDMDKPEKAVDLAVRLVKDLKSRNPKAEIAVLAPFKATVLNLQGRLGSEIDDFTGITIETIDRIQGLTVDFTIYILALSNPSFAMNLNRFNVATSRAKSGTLIITDPLYVKLKGIHPKVSSYLSQIQSITLENASTPTSL